MTKSVLGDAAAPVDSRVQAQERVIRFLQFFTGAMALVGLTGTVLLLV